MLSPWYSKAETPVLVDLFVKAGTFPDYGHTSGASKFSDAKAQSLKKCYQASDLDESLRPLCWPQAHHEQLSLSCALERPVPLLICRRQLACLILQLLQLLQLRHAIEHMVGVNASSRVQPVPSPKLETHSPVHVPDLVVQGQEGHWGVNGLAALGTEAYHFQPCLVDLLCELVDGDVTWGTDKYRPTESRTGC